MPSGRGVARRTKEKFCGAVFASRCYNDNGNFLLIIFGEDEIMRREFVLNKEFTKKIAFMGVMTAITAICSLTFPYGLTFRVGEFMKMSPVFIVVAITGKIYGPVPAGIVAFLGDLIQGILFGNISPLISAINLLVGLCFGLLKYRDGLLPIVVTVLITQTVGSLVLTSSVLFFRYGMPVFPTLWFRVLQTAILIAVEIPVLYLLLERVQIHKKLIKR